MKALTIIFVTTMFSACEIMPRNNIKDCNDQCKNTKKQKACTAFCDSIHLYGQPLNKCLDDYENAIE